jgi:hypothetical protein
VLAFAAATVGLGIVFGDAFVGYERDLQRLLGPGSSAWLEHAQVAGWQPDPNFKPVTYFVRRRADEAIFRRLAGESKLAVRPSAAVPEAIWQLPADMAFPGWAADKVPAGAGLDVRGSIGDAMIFARWYADDLWLVVTPGPQ